MKMADNSLMTFQNNCESINRNGVEVIANHIKANDTNEDSGKPEIIVNKPDNQPQDDVLQNSSDILTQGDVVDEFLAGENNLEFNNDLLCNMDNGNEGILFKSENVIPECSDESLDKAQFGESVNHDTDNAPQSLQKASTSFIVKNLKRRSIKCLNKMQIMEDVREGCNVQPSSPGHAEQGVDEEVKVKAETSENGYEEQNSTANQSEDNDEDQEEDKKRFENDGEATETNKTEFSEINNEENYSNASSPSVEGNKRKSDNEDFPVKRLRTEKIDQNFRSRDKLLNEFVEMAECNNLEQIHTFSEQLLAEIKTLNELAKEKEREWNTILHLKKMKEELLLRMQRKRQVILINEKSDFSDLISESYSDNLDDRSKSGSPHSILKSNLINPQKSALRIPNVSLNGDKSKHRTILPKLPHNTVELNGSLDLRQGKQRPVIDVRSIIADYRQRHPEAVPRRGRRIRNSHTDGSNKSGNVLNFASMTLGSGSQVRQNVQGIDASSEFGMLLSSMNGNKSDCSKILSSETSTSTTQDTTSFRDMLLQFAKLSQSERTELMQNFKPPPPYPEVTVHPVPTTTAAPTNSLLHGILTKSPSKQNNKTGFSPTLARLLTAPERAVSTPVTSTPTLSSSTAIHPSNMSISEILSTSKARNEITITPVGSQYESAPSKGKPREEEEAEDSADRLVIDESNEGADGRRGVDNSSETGEEVPPCQGCNQKPAQFVCAGCGNQWYCSRDCQVSAWDEHSEVCSG